jgi:hypothetical protein
MASIGKEYDIALKALLYSRFKTILGIADLEQKDAIVQAPVEIAQREMAEHRQENFLDFISFYRSSLSPSWSRQRTPLARRGLWLDQSTHVKAQPMDIGYDVWFWSKDIDKLYEAIEEYIFWQQDYPKVTLTYLDTYEITPDLHFGDIVDESTYDQKYEKGIIFRYRMPVKIDGWILKTITGEDIINKIQLTVYDKDSLEDTDYSTIIVEDSNQDTELESALRFFRRSLYGIQEVNTTTNYVVIGEDRSSDFTIGNKIIIQGSTDNNGVYTVLGIVVLGTTIKITRISLTENLTSTTADGVVYKAD